MGEAAVKAAKAAGYVNAGTIEFLLEKSGAYYFMEMNTRIQVEHPVTEMVTGVDLIEEMIRISSGERLRYRQKDIAFCGHSIECRISAEDPEKGFLPGAGTVTGLFLPGGNGVRVDSMLYDGCRVPPFYDSMLAKVIVHGRTRDEAVRKMRRALGEFVIEGIQTNLDFQYDLVGTQLFLDGNTEAINEILEARCREAC
jgi:acetyl-CoA carboxylase biotin carboxylase subunit